MTVRSSKSFRSSSNSSSPSLRQVLSQVKNIATYTSYAFTQGSKRGLPTTSS
ncbi:hypothetical protein KI387_012929, partial [Taxus chinensis]